MENMKKSTFLFISLSLSLSLLFRMYLMVQYSITHEVGIDSFFYHVEANVLMKYHHFTWWLNPLSLFGLYPYSDSPGVPSYVAMISSLSGLSLEESALIYSFLIVSFGIVTMFILSLKIFYGKKFVSFLSSFVFGIAPILIPNTIWGFGERETFVYMIPLVVLLIFLIVKNNAKLFNLKIIFLMISYMMILGTIHILAVFLYGLFIAAPFIWLLDKSAKCKNVFLFHKRYIKFFTYIIISLIMVYLLFIVNQFIVLPYRFSIENYKNTALFSGTNPLIILLNMGVSYSGGIGILFPLFFPIGYIYLILKKRNTFAEKYFLGAFILSLPITINRLYSRPLMVFIGSIIIGYGIYFFSKKLDHFSTQKIGEIIKIAGMVFLIISSLFFSSFMFSHWIEVTYEKPEVKYTISASPSAYEMGIYQKYEASKIWISNDWLTAQRIQAYSNVPTQPASASTHLIFNPVFYSLINENQLNIKKSDKLFFYTYRWYYSTYTINEHKDYVRLFNTYYKSKLSMEIISKYNIQYVLEYREISNRYTGYYSEKVYNSIFLRSVSTSCYKTFENSKFKMFLI